MDCPPLTRSELAALTAIDTTTPIPPPLLTRALAHPPFLPVPGVLNLRDLGLLPSSPIKPRLIYRSGALHSQPPPSLAALKQELNVSLILDLRSPWEAARSPDPEIEGVERVRVAVEGEREREGGMVKPVDLGEFVEEGGRRGYVALYGEVLEGYGVGLRRVLEWVRDRDEERDGALLVHCSAGKDRTGVFAAILLSLAGASEETIAFDYELTRVGIEPAREMLQQMLRLWNKEWTEDTPGMTEFCSIKGGFILGTLEMMGRKYGGVEQYVRRLGFGDEDLGKIKRVLRGQ